MEPCALCGSVSSLQILEISAHAGGAKGDLERGLDVDGRAIFHGGLELPFRNCLAGELVEAVVNAAENTHVADGAIGVDDRVEDHGSGYVLAHELQRVGGINFSRGGGLGEISCGAFASGLLESGVILNHG